VYYVTAKFVPNIKTADQQQRIISQICARILTADQQQQQLVDICTQKFLKKHKMALIPHPAYSPDLALCDFVLFPKMKQKLKESQFDTIQKIQAEPQSA
jgi:hypothetical protein